jgi:hypothetical protein
VQLSIPYNANELLSGFKKTKQWTTKVEIECFPASIARFFGNIFDKEDWGYTNVSHEKDVVNMKNLMKEKIRPLMAQFTKAIELGRQNVETNSSGLLKYFEDRVAELNAKVKKRALDMEDLLLAKGKLEASISENESKKFWLEQFRKELDAVLEI